MNLCKCGHLKSLHEDIGCMALITGKEDVDVCDCNKYKEKK